MKQTFTSAIDLFYPPFRKIMPEQTFRYAFCGGVNTALGLGIYTVFYSYVFAGEDVWFSGFAFKPHTASLFVAFCVNFLLGFILNKYIVFTSSDLRGRIQLIRYFISFLSNLGINYLFLKLFVEFLQWNAIFSQFITTAIVVAISYFSQKHFSFRSGSGPA